VTVEEFVRHLHGVKETSNGYTARCPGHEDQHNSLSVSEGDDGRILLKDFAGCMPEAVVQALGLTMADLFDQSENHSGKRERGVPPQTRRNRATGARLFVGSIR